MFSTLAGGITFTKLEGLPATYIGLQFQGSCHHQTHIKIYFVTNACHSEYLWLREYFKEPRSPYCKEILEC